MKNERGESDAFHFGGRSNLRLNNSCLCEKPYLATGKAYAACVGEQMRFVYNPPEMIRDVIKIKCGKLEELERDLSAMKKPAKPKPTPQTK
jgi:hypothetical protein